MSRAWKYRLFLWAVSIGAIVFLIVTAGCNTLYGIGRDVEGALRGARENLMSQDD